MKNLRTGVVGVGHMGVNHARLYSEIPGSEFAAVFDSNAENAAAAPPSPSPVIPTPSSIFFCAASAAGSSCVPFLILSPQAHILFSLSPSFGSAPILTPALVNFLLNASMSTLLFAARSRSHFFSRSFSTVLVTFSFSRSRPERTVIFCDTDLFPMFDSMQLRLLR